MESAPVAPNERERLEALRGLRVLDTPPDERFDRITRLAARVFEVPIALVSLVDADRQWFKSGVGFEVEQTPRGISFCGHAILEDGVFEVPDAVEDRRFADNPLVSGDPDIRFYAGTPLEAPDGSQVGTLCIIDRQPRELTDEDREILADLGSWVEAELQAHALVQAAAGGSREDVAS